LAGAGSSGGGLSSSLTGLEANAKLDRIVQMVTASQASTQQSIEALRTEFQKEQEDTAERAAKKAHMSAEVTFRKKGKEK